MSERSSVAERLVTRLAERTGRRRPSRRGFIGGAALVGAALAVDPLGYLTRPASAYDAVCGSDNTCAAGYTVFCCTINGGNNTCPPDSFVGGWWKADHSSFCGGNARYYIDCNAYRDGRYTCHCNSTTCDQRRVACNQFRYGQCNTQIPWSNTGPVLCRVVSCTPPWVQYGGSCSSSSATDNNTATHSAPCLSGRQPVGLVDTVTSTGNTVHITGWAYDPDSPSTSIKVAIYADGHGLMAIHANVPRPDVNAGQHVSGNHGFSAVFQAPTGKHTYRVYALNIGGGSGNPLLGGRTIVVNAGSPPIGHLDRCDPTPDRIVLEGWALDRDQPGTSIKVHIYQDGKPVMSVPTAIARPDVNAAYHVSGTHGFRATFPTTPGTHNFKVYAINVGGGTGNPLIGNHSTVVPGQAPADAGATRYAVRPAGRLESVTVGGNSVRLVGWAHDPDRPDAQAAIAIREDDEVLHWYPTGVARPDLAGARYGFDVTVPAGTGVHTYSVHLLDTAEPLVVGERTVRVGQAGPVGRVDRLVEAGGEVRLTGWAYDPDQPTRQLALTCYRDGAPVATGRTGLDRPPWDRTQLDRSELGGGALDQPGFELVLPALPGRHTYTVYAAATEKGGRQVLLGSRTVDPADELEAMVLA